MLHFPAAAAIVQMKLNKIYLIFGTNAMKLFIPYFYFWWRVMHRQNKKLEYRQKHQAPTPSSTWHILFSKKNECKTKMISSFLFNFRWLTYRLDSFSEFKCERANISYKNCNSQIDRFIEFWRTHEANGENQKNSWPLQLGLSCNVWNVANISSKRRPLNGNGLPFGILKSESTIKTKIDVIKLVA